jgi:tetratricopeptide (TPR) repeat protein
MKKIFLFIFISCSMLSYSQEIVLSEQVKEYYRKVGIANDYFGKIYHNPDLLGAAIKSYEEVFAINVPESVYAVHYRNYADLLAQSGEYDKAVQFYDKAFELKKMKAKEFGYGYRKGYFGKDTLLHNKKLQEYNKRTTISDIELLIAVKEMLAMDQFARYYHSDFPQHKDCSKNIILYVDSITMEKWVELMKKYPEYSDPLSIDFEAAFVIGRHIFTAYPEFWLTHFEANARESVISGQYNPQGYARTYDRCMITSGRAEYSYYGEWNNDGKNANPDNNLVNKRRENLGLPPLGEKNTEERKIFITY